MKAKKSAHFSWIDFNTEKKRKQRSRAIFDISGIFTREFGLI